MQVRVKRDSEACIAGLQTTEGGDTEMEANSERQAPMGRYAVSFGEMVEAEDPTGKWIEYGLTWMPGWIWGGSDDCGTV